MAIIPARAGSRGVPHKNFRELLGKPVICYTIEAALAAQTVNRVVVTTDEPKMEAVCRDYQIDYLARPAELASDMARIDDVLRHACTAAEAQDGYRPDIIVMLYANVPVRADDIIDRGVRKLIETGCDSVQTVEPVGRYHPYWLQKLDGDRMSKYIDNTVHRRQDLPPVYALDGCLGVVTYQALMAAAGSSNPHAFWGQDRRAVVQKEHETVDIDALRDFFIAEAALREKRGETVLS
jgi:CMP-N-acetylneuraminic acid synthetase